MEGGLNNVGALIRESLMVGVPRRTDWKGSHILGLRMVALLLAASDGPRRVVEEFGVALLLQ